MSFMRQSRWASRLPILLQEPYTFNLSSNTFTNSGIPCCTVDQGLSLVSLCLPFSRPMHDRICLGREMFSDDMPPQMASSRLNKFKRLRRKFVIAKIPQRHKMAVRFIRIREECWHGIRCYGDCLRRHKKCRSLNCEWIQGIWWRPDQGRCLQKKTKKSIMLRVVSLRTTS